MKEPLIAKLDGVTLLVVWWLGLDVNKIIKIVMWMLNSKHELRINRLSRD